MTTFQIESNGNSVNSLSHTCTLAESKRFSDENYSCGEFISEDEFTSESERCILGNFLQFKVRRNAIDFSPMDVTKHESDDSLEYEETYSKCSCKSVSNRSSSSWQEMEIMDKLSNSLVSENFNNNCSCLDEMSENFNNNSSFCTLSKREGTIYKAGNNDNISYELTNHISEEKFESVRRKLSRSSSVETEQLTFNSNTCFKKNHGNTARSSVSTVNLDIFTNYTLSYNSFSKSCHSLCNLSLIPSNENNTSQVSLTYPNSVSTTQQYTAKGLLSSLECCFAYMHGGKDLNDAPIICFPHYTELRLISDEDFEDTILYLTSIASACDADAGFVLILDRRRDKWSAVRSILSRLATCIPASLRSVFVLRPAGFFQGTMSNLGMKFLHEDFLMKVPVLMLSTLDELYEYVRPEQLTQEFGGSFDYDHNTWMRNRVLLEDFSTQAIDVGFALNAYGFELTQTELPNDVEAARSLLKTQQDSTNTYKTKLDTLKDAASGLRETILGPMSSSLLPNSYSSLEIETLDSMISLVDETDVMFKKFWNKYEEKLKQCLLLRQFELDYRDIRSKLKHFEMWIEQRDEATCNSLSNIQILFEKTQEFKEGFDVCHGECNRLVAEGERLTQHHYAVDCIAPKCAELLEISSNLSESFRKQIECLKEDEKILQAVNELNDWCNNAPSVLDGYTVEENQTKEHINLMLIELENFLDNKKPKQISCESIPCNLVMCVNATNRRLEEVENLYEKRRKDLQTSLSKHSDRSIEKVEPSSKLQTGTESRRKSDEMKKINVTTLENLPSQFSPPSTPKLINHSDPAVKLQHAMKELISTEQNYVNELKSIVEGYGDSIDDESFAHILPEKLRGKRKVLLGNMEDILQFHEKIFLSELELSQGEPKNIGQCFINRKQDFKIYAEYCQNSSKSEHLRSSIGEKHPFFLECQRKLSHRLSLGAYLLKPIQRLTKYQLLLQQILKYCHSGKCELKEAIDTMLDVLRSVNDSMHQTAIVGFQGDFTTLGQLLVQGSLLIEQKKSKGKNLSRPRFNKTWQRHVFLYEKEMLLCKQQNVESANADSSASGNSSQHINSAPGGVRGHHYLYKSSLKMKGAGLTETIKNDTCKFELWYKGREEVYAFQAANVQQKQIWLKEIKALLAAQPKSQVAPQESVNTGKSKSTKTKRTQSLTRRNRPASAQPERSRIKSESKKNPSLIRSASMEKTKEKNLKRASTSQNVKKKKGKSEESLNAEIVPETFQPNIKSSSMPRIDDQSCPSDFDEGFHSQLSQVVLPPECASTGYRFSVIKERTNVKEGEVVLKVGDIVQILESGKKEGWVKVRVEETRSVGLAPTNHIRSLSDASSFDSVASFTST